MVDIWVEVLGYDPGVDYGIGKHLISDSMVCLTVRVCVVQQPSSIVTVFVYKCKRVAVRRVLGVVLNCENAWFLTVPARLSIVNHPRPGLGELSG